MMKGCSSSAVSSEKDLTVHAACALESHIHDEVERLLGLRPAPEKINELRLLAIYGSPTAENIADILGICPEPCKSILYLFDQRRIVSLRSIQTICTTLNEEEKEWFCEQVENEVETRRFVLGNRWERCSENIIVDSRETDNRIVSETKRDYSEIEGKKDELSREADKEGVMLSILSSCPDHVEGQHNKLLYVSKEAYQDDEKRAGGEEKSVKKLKSSIALVDMLAQKSGTLKEYRWILAEYRKEFVALFRGGRPCMSLFAAFATDSAYIDDFLHFREQYLKEHLLARKRDETHETKNGNKTENTREQSKKVHEYRDRSGTCRDNIQGNRKMGSHASEEGMVGGRRMVSALRGREGEEACGATTQEITKVRISGDCREEEMIKRCKTIHGRQQAAITDIKKRSDRRRQESEEGPRLDVSHLESQAPYNTVIGNSSLNHLQRRCLLAIEHSTSNILVVSPTNSGKTMIALLASAKALEKEGGRVFYSAPVKALVDENAAVFRKAFPHVSLLVLSSDYERPSYDTLSFSRICVGTPEKMDVVTRAGHRFTLIIFDEVHLLGSRRGTAIEAVVARTFFSATIDDMDSSQDTRIVCLTATICGLEPVCKFFRVESENCIVSTEAAQSAKWEHVPCTYGPSATAAAAARVVRSRMRTLVFVNGREQTIEVATAIVEARERARSADNYWDRGDGKANNGCNRKYESEGVRQGEKCEEKPDSCNSKQRTTLLADLIEPSPISSSGTAKMKRGGGVREGTPKTCEITGEDKEEPRKNSRHDMTSEDTESGTSTIVQNDILKGNGTYTEIRRASGNRMYKSSAETDNNEYTYIKGPGGRRLTEPSDNISFCHGKKKALFTNYREKTHTQDISLDEIQDDRLLRLVRSGVGVHHAGLSEKDRRIVEKLYSENRLSIIVCTTTLAWGINLNCDLVLAYGVFEAAEILQIFGRAGRGIKSPRARCLHFGPPNVTRQDYLPSYIEDDLAFHLNAEINAQRITSLSDAMKYVSMTYWASLLATQDRARDEEKSSRVVTEAVFKAIALLEHHNMVKDMRTGSVLGTISAKLYIRPDALLKLSAMNRFYNEALIWELVGDMMVAEENGEDAEKRKFYSENRKVSNKKQCNTSSGYNEHITAGITVSLPFPTHSSFSSFIQHFMAVKENNRNEPVIGLNSATARNICRLLAAILEHCISRRFAISVEAFRAYTKICHPNLVRFQADKGKRLNCVLEKSGEGIHKLTFLFDMNAETAESDRIPSDIYKGSESGYCDDQHVRRSDESENLAKDDVESIRIGCKGRKSELKASIILEEGSKELEWRRSVNKHLEKRSGANSLGNRGGNKHGSTFFTLERLPEHRKKMIIFVTDSLDLELLHFEVTDYVPKKVLYLVYSGRLINIRVFYSSSNQSSLHSLCTSISAYFSKAVLYLHHLYQDDGCLVRQNDATIEQEIVFGDSKMMKKTTKTNGQLNADREMPESYGYGAREDRGNLMKRAKVEIDTDADKLMEVTKIGQLTDGHMSLCALSSPSNHICHGDKLCQDSDCGSSETTSTSRKKDKRCCCYLSKEKTLEIVSWNGISGDAVIVGFPQTRSLVRFLSYYEFLDILSADEGKIERNMKRLAEQRKVLRLRTVLIDSIELINDTLVVQAVVARLLANLHVFKETEFYGVYSNETYEIKSGYFIDGCKLLPGRGTLRYLCTNDCSQPYQRNHDELLVEKSNQQSSENLKAGHSSLESKTEDYDSSGGEAKEYECINRKSYLETPFDPDHCSEGDLDSQYATARGCDRLRAISQYDFEILVSRNRFFKTKEQPIAISKTEVLNMLNETLLISNCSGKHRKIEQKELELMVEYAFDCECLKGIEEIKDGSGKKKIFRLALRILIYQGILGIKQGRLLEGMEDTDEWIANLRSQKLFCLRRCIHGIVAVSVYKKKFKTALCAMYLLSEIWESAYKGFSNDQVIVSKKADAIVLTVKQQPPVAFIVLLLSESFEHLKVVVRDKGDYSLSWNIPSTSFLVCEVFEKSVRL